MSKRSGKGSLFALLVGSFVFSVIAVATPSFTDQDIGNGYVNPNDQVIVQKIKVVDGSSTITSVWIRNLGEANETDITKIVIDNDDHPFTDPKGEYTTLTGLRSGITVPLGYVVPSGTTYLWIGVEIAGAAHDARNIQLQVRFYSGSYTSDLITDGSPETIFRGGFEKKTDYSLSVAYLNPGDTGVLVQKARFTDDDGNSSPVGITNIAVSNTKNADNNDVASVQVKVTGKVSDTSEIYTASKPTGTTDWGSGNPLEFLSADFTPNLPASFDDDSIVTVEVYVSVKADPGDKHGIQTSMALTTKENGKTYTQVVESSTVRTIRVQGFEAATDVSPDLPSGVLSPDQILVQKVTVTDDDANALPVTVTGIRIKNNGDATKGDIKKIVVKRASSGTTVFTLDGNNIIDFSTGHTYTTGFTPVTVADDDSVMLAIEYTANGMVTDGHTLQPEIYFITTEGGANYNSDAVTYPKSIVLHPYGLEAVNNVSPPSGGTAYSGQRLLAQKISCEDLDENTDSVRINPIVIKNVAATSRCAESEVTKIEVCTESGDLLGEVIDLSGLNSGGVTISTLENNVIADDHTLMLYVYVTFTGPEGVTEGHKLKLETTVFSEENGHTGENSATGAEWTLAINHRPTCDFDYTPSTDLTYQTEITFTAKDVNDEDGDDIVAYRWEFSDGGTGTGASVKHTFTTGGSVWAELTVEDARGLTGSKRKILDVEPPPVTPIAKFTWTPESPQVGEEVQFTDASTTPAGTTITKWSWDFDGNGTEDSNEQNPKYTYTAAGKYNVSLTVTNSEDQTDKVTQGITVIVPAPTAKFSYLPELPHVNELVQFTDESTISGGITITAWSWDFGDGENSTERNPTHKYMHSGFYQVELTVTASDGKTASITRRISVLGKGTDILTYAYPNPASAEATIAYALPDGATDPVLRIYDISGRLVREEDLPAGERTYQWNLRDDGGDALPNGLYFCLVSAKNANGRTVRSDIFRLLIVR